MKRYGLSADERIKSRKDFELIYSSGTTIFSADRRIKAIYLISAEADSPGVKIAPAVSKKAGKAVWRNRVKRLIKEAYRLNKEILTGLSLQNDILIKIVLSPNMLNERTNKNIRLNEVAPGILEILLKIKSVCNER